MEIIQAIKAEVERLIRNLQPKNVGYIWKKETYRDILSFLSTLEEQTKCKVSNPIFDECVANVDSEVRKEVRENIDFEQALYDHFGQVKDFTLGMRIGKYFYELGCRRTAEKYDEIEYNRQREEEKPMQDGLDEDLINEADRIFYSYEIHEGYYLEPIIDCVSLEQFHGIARHFAEWQKEQNDKDLSEKIAAAYQLGLADKEKQMMKEAVEGEVCIPNVWVEHKEGKELVVRAEISKELGFKFGDVVRIIIVKE